MESISERLTAAIRDAGRAVNEAELPEEFRAAAFERALSVMLEHGGLRGAMGQAGLPPAAEPMLGTSAMPGDVVRDPLHMVASRAGVTDEQIKEVFSLDGDELNVVVGARRIDPQPSQGSRELTLLVAGARQAAGLEEWTPLKRAREVCEHYSRLDSKNYAAVVVRGLDTEFSFRGQGVGREVRMTMPGWDAFSDLVKRLLGQANGA